MFPPGECASKPFGAKPPLLSNPRLAARDHEQRPRSRDPYPFGKRLPTAEPIETAPGSSDTRRCTQWAYAVVSTVKPEARDTPNSPILTWGKAAASTALPQPPNTNQKVQRNAAIAFL